MPNITKAFVRAVKCEDGKPKQEFYDDSLKGFMLEVRSNGRKTYFLKFISLDGSRKSIKIADASILDADAARLKAIKLKRSIEEGKDVILDTPEPKPIVQTLKQFYEEYYLPHIKSHSKSWMKNDSTYRIHILPALGHKAMNEITPYEISKIHSNMTTTKNLSNGTANKIIIFLRHAYNLAIKMKIGVIAENPAKAVKRLEEINRERFLTKAEAKRLIKAVDTSRNPYLKYIIPFLILTGARRSEVLRARWRDVDYERGMWTIPITKNKKIRKIPMSESLLELIKTIPKTSEFLFPAPKRAGHYIDIFIPWDNARTKAGLKDLRLHDLRHSFASQLVNSGRSLYEVQMLLGHSDVKMTQRYAHLNNDSLLAAASCAGRLLK